MRMLALSEKGREHTSNEDSYVSCRNIAIIADGMGGENSGEVASRLATEIIVKQLSAISSGEANVILNRMKDGLLQADDAIRSYECNHPETVGMGTTIVAVLRIGVMLYVCWCGDSRCYIFNPNTGLRQLTKDHSYVQELIDSGEITIEESFVHPDSNLVTRFIGGGLEFAVPECCKYALEPDEIIILCSDGLSGYCADSDIEAAVRKNMGNPKAMCQSLKALSLSHGSTDDITIMVSDTRPRFPWRLFK